MGVELDDAGAGSSWPPTLFVVRTVQASPSVIVAEIADVLGAERWESIRAAHPEISLYTASQAEATLSDALNRWREHHAVSRDKARQQWDEYQHTGKPPAGHDQETRAHRARIDHLRRTKQLTPLDRELLELRLLGLSMREIAQVLEVNIRAVQKHFLDALITLGVPTLAEAAERLKSTR